LRENEKGGMIMGFPVNSQSSKFSFNPQVFRMVLIVLIALAVPLTVAMLGFWKLTKGAPQEAVAEPAMPGLQAALEQAADKNWQPALEISYGRSVFYLAPSTSPEEARKRVASAVSELQGTILPASEEAGGGRILIQIPTAGASEFESKALLGFVPKIAGSQTGDTRLSEIHFSTP
jgi:hypothetical protein